MENNETADKAAETEKPKRSIGALAAFVGKHILNAAKAAWRVDAVKSAVGTWLVRASIPGVPIIIAIADSYISGQ